MRIRQWLLAASVSLAPVLATAQGRGDLSSIPEPETLALLAAGVIALLITRKRGRK